MSNDAMGLDELAKFLRRDARELDKLAKKGQLPAQRVGGKWRFHSTEISHWVSTRLTEASDAELTSLDHSQPETPNDPLLETLLPPACVAVPLLAHSRSSVLRELVQLAEQSWQVYDPEAILSAVVIREERGSTAMPDGVALPHPHRPLPNALGDSVIALARTARGIPFGSGTGLTDLFFLVLCTDTRTHLRVLARLSRLLRRPHLIDALRGADDATEARQLLLDAEKQLLNEQLA